MAHAACWMAARPEICRWPAGAIESAAEQALRAGQIIRRLREFVARGESDRQSEDLRPLIEEASALALVGARESGVRFTLTVANDVPAVMADKVQVQQVLLNLMRNAIEAMQGRTTRELTLAIASEDDELVQIDVADTGSGIAPEILPKLFQPLSPPSRRAWAWAFPFRARLSKRMAAGLGGARARRRHYFPSDIAERRAGRMRQCRIMP